MKRFFHESQGFAQAVGSCGCNARCGTHDDSVRIGRNCGQEDLSTADAFFWGSNKILNCALHCCMAAPPGSVLGTTEPREATMKYLHTMVRVTDVDGSLDFYCNKLGLTEVRRIENENGRFTLIFLAAPGDESAQVELTYNWDPESYSGGRNFGHLAYAVDNIYELCEHLMKNGVTINRPPRDGRMAFVRSPDNISIELLQKDGSLEPKEPWLSMPNTGEW
jgi:lactoylglutathione lyase